MGHEQPVDEGHTGHLPGTPDILPVDRPELDDPVRVTQGKRQGRPVEVDNHPGDRGVGICGYPVPESEDGPGQRIAIIPQILLREEQARADGIWDFCPAMGNGYQERRALFHRDQQKGDRAGYFVNIWVQAPQGQDILLLR